MVPLDLEPAIRKVLTAPGVDLNLISAKAVRKRLQSMDPSLTYEWMKENRGAIDAIIGEIFQSVSEAASASGSGDANGVHEDEDAEGAAEEEGEGEEGLRGSPKRPAKKRQKKSGQEKMDAEYARQLSNELNSRSRSSRSTVRPGAGKKGGSGKRKKPLTADTVNSDEDGSDQGSTVGKKRKARGGGGAKGGFSKEYNLSEPLVALLGVERLSRPQTVKQLWEYIKGHELQDPNNKKVIVGDEKFRAVFGQARLDMFQMNKLLGDHLRADEE
ncbi:hypothetical protein BJ322DRAFT_635606 [Thelephora terrestris]|uniref:DM2 domain-containing protein n=1 Tax=Thelephora terrestris TaxID=56493 RepID=A0A9P6HK68_9AGAM|nr:hypothetical protein BJ322DRAFT_635606 [Thelephora terrestris]